MSTTAEVLRVAAGVIASQPHIRVDVVTAIRIAAGPGRLAHELAERVLRVFAAHLGYEADGDPSDDLKRWSSRQPTDHIIAELYEAADLAETGGS